MRDQETGKPADPDEPPGNADADRSEPDRARPSRRSTARGASAAPDPDRGSITDERAAIRPVHGQSRARLRRARFGRLRREFVGGIVLLVLAVVCIVLVTVVLFRAREDATLAARDAAAYTPPPLATTSDAATPVVAMIGDETVATGRGGWMQRLRDELGVRIEAFTGSGAGYTIGGRGGATFVDQVSRVPSGADVVVFVGGAADLRSDQITLAKAASQAFAEAARQAPTAQVVVIGPLYSASEVESPQLRTVRGALRGAARIAGVTWVDPISESWLPPMNSAKELTSGQQAEIAERIEDRLKKALS